MFKVRQLLIFFSCLVVVAPLAAQSLNQQTLDSFLADSKLRNADVGMIFYDAETGAEVLQKNADKKLIPASSHKLLVRH